VRIVFLGTSCLDDPGPRGRYFPIARELARAGHDVHLLLLHPTFDAADVTRRFDHDGVHVAYVSQMHVYGHPGQRRYYSPAVLLSVSLRAAIALAANARRLQPDVIHIAKAQPINGLAGLLARRRPVKLCLDCDDYEAESNRFAGRWQRWGVRWWEDFLPRHADAVSLNTRFTYDRCRELGVPAERLFRVPNGVSEWQFRRPEREMLESLRQRLGCGSGPLVIYFGAMHGVAHGLDLLLEAVAALRRDSPEARLLMVGDGDDLPSLKARAAEIGIATAISWAGRVPPEEVAGHVALADCSVDPVHDTPAARARFPLKIVESMAQGVPVVTGEVGDRREILAGGHAGRLVRAGDAAALATGMREILSDAGLRTSLSARAREHAETYRWEHIIQRWLEMY
jgi:glycosyltransferase involved in cell wall biosynthesis